MVFGLCGGNGIEMIKINYCKFCQGEIKGLPFFICRSCTELQMYDRYYKHIPIKNNLYSRMLRYGITIQERKEIMKQAHQDRKNGVKLIEMKNDKAVRNCRRCGTPVEDFRGYWICTGCIVDEIYDQIASGKELTRTMKENARRRNIDTDEIRENVMEDAKIQK